MAGQLMLVNPRKRRRRATTRRRKAPARRLAASTTRVTRRRYRRNPIRKGGKMMDTFIGSAIGAGGALAVDFAMQKLPLPATLTGTPIMAAATRGFVGIGLGMLVSKFGKNKRLGQQLAGGATTVALYTASKGMFGTQLGLSGYGDGLLGYSDGLLAYSDFDDLGWIDAEPVSVWDGGDTDYAAMGGFDEFDS